MSPKPKLYINANTTARLIEILDLNAQLKRDIVHKTERKAIIWKRNEDGTLQRISLHNTPEVEIVGSLAR